MFVEREKNDLAYGTRIMEMIYVSQNKKMDPIKGILIFSDIHFVFNDDTVDQSRL